MNDQLERGCIVPLAQSVVSGLFTALLGWAWCGWRGWPDGHYFALLAGAVGAALWWWWRILNWQAEFRQLYFEDQVQPVTPDPARVKVELHQDENGSHHTQIADLNASPDQLVQLAQGLLQGQTFSESVWCGAGRPFSKSEFHQLRTALIKRGWVTMRNPHAPAQGFCLTRPGAAVMRSFASDLPYSSVRVEKSAR